MTGPEAVVAIVMLEWIVGLVGVSAWTQSWREIKRGHFRIIGWTSAGLAISTLAAERSSSLSQFPERLVIATLASVGVYIAHQYFGSDMGATVVGLLATTIGAAALLATGADLPGWPAWLAGLHLAAGAVLLGGVTNGMLLGHWYLNQPGLRPAALARLTALAFAGFVATGVLGLASVSRLASSETRGAVLGLPGFGDSFGAAFFGAWVVLLVFTGAVVWMARRCVLIKSIQSATGLYYVALLTAGVSEFIVRYLMVGATA